MAFTSSPSLMYAYAEEAAETQTDTETNETEETESESSDNESEEASSEETEEEEEEIDPDAMDEETLNKLKAKLEKNKQKLENLSEQHEKELELQKTLLEDVKDTQALLDEYIDQVEKLDEEISAKEVEITAKETDLNERKALFKERLRAMYISGNTTQLEVILSATDFGDFLARTELVQSVSEHDNDLMDELMDSIISIEEAKAQLKSDLEKVTAKKSEMEKEKESLQKKIMDSQDAMTAISSQADHIKDQLAADSQREAAIADALSNSGIEYDFSSGEFAGGPDPVSGLFQWPVPTISTISSYYGMRWGRLHAGIDIAGGASTYGSDIVAARSGTVSLIANQGGSGWGLYVMVDHGIIDNIHYATLYAHCSKIKAVEGETVKAGQTIALIGSTGWSTGPHLHFEIYVNGSRINPLNYV
ncbi:MAG TPA: hypothetical protein DEQ02_01585 [Ruminococcaceae bacterium]|nr:hypothetical protein [Oscillospiraceae bacterium]